MSVQAPLAVQSRNAMQANFATDCINQTSLFWVTLHYTNLPTSTVGRGEGRAKAVEQEVRAATKAAFTPRAFLPHDGAAKSGQTGMAASHCFALSTRRWKSITEIVSSSSNTSWLYLIALHRQQGAGSRSLTSWSLRCIVDKPLEVDR